SGQLRLTSLLHADILSSRFDQQANQSWKLSQAGLEPTAPLEDPECFFGNLCLAQLAPPLLSSLPGCFVGAAPDWNIPPRTSCHQDGPSLDEL
ncbi:4-hydroxybenzoate octaprenyltransferase, partial [Frankliniella fusca]